MQTNTTIVPFVASVDQDQAAQNVQPDLSSTLSTLRKTLRNKRTMMVLYRLPEY